jgi:hypothetical protein
VVAQIPVAQLSSSAWGLPASIVANIGAIAGATVSASFTPLAS